MSGGGGNKRNAIKNGRKTDGTFGAGNSGRPKGRNKRTLALEAIFDGEAEKLSRKAIEMALSGDGTAMRLCLERIIPARKDRPISFNLPSVEKSSDAEPLLRSLLAAVASGSVTPSEAGEVSKLVTCYLEAVKANEFEARLRVLEGKQ